MHLPYKGLHVTFDSGGGRFCNTDSCRCIPYPLSLSLPSPAQPAPAAANAVEKKKLWDAVQPGLNTSAELVATWKGQPLNVPAGPLKSATLVGARVA